MLISPLMRPTQKNYYGKHILYFPSRKNQQQIICHSMLEADYCVHLEYDDLVNSYISQPQMLNFEIDGQRFQYTPDFRVETNETHYFTEVKYDLNAQSARTQSKLTAASQYCESQGSELQRADANSIRPTPWFWNIKWLYFQSFNVNADEFGLCLKWLDSLPLPLTMRELLSHPAAIRERAIYRALFTKKLSTDLNTRLTVSSVVNHTESQ